MKAQRDGRNVTLTMTADEAAKVEEQLLDATTFESETDVVNRLQEENRQLRTRMAAALKALSDEAREPKGSCRD